MTSKILLALTLFTLAFAACKSDTQEKAAITPTTTEKKNKPKTTKEIIELDKVYNAQEVDTPAVFDNICNSESNPSKCSQAKVREYINANVNMPRSAQNANIREREVIAFTILPDGSVNGDLRSISKKEVCDGCRDAAIEVISNMSKWSPAMKDGKAVPMSMVVPVSFK